ncbi:MAG: sulfite exporter TauE/SafE family protein [Calditrichia bacterium]
MELWQVALLFGVGSMAGMINVLAGGGSSLTLPALIFLGLDSALANGTNRVAIIMQNIFATASFRKQQVSNFNLSVKLALWTLPGAIIGAIMAVRISDEWFQTILAIVLIGVIISMFFSPAGKQNLTANLDGKPNWLIYPAMFGIGFYGGFIQVGVGFLLMASLFHLLRTSLVYVNMHKVLIVLIYTIPALAIFIYSDKVDWGFGLSLAAGNAFGAWWAAKFAVKIGDKVVRYVLILAIVIMILKLLKVF